MIPIVRACADPRYKRVVAVLGSQMGKTEGLFNVMGHRLDDDPTPILYIGPTQKNVESISSDRVMKMLRSAPQLWERLAKGKRNKITEKFVSGVRLGFGWAGSGTELSSHPAGLVFVDERDRMEAVKGEGDPVELADARIATYPDGRVCVVSTPTEGSVTTDTDEHGIERWAASEDVRSPIWRLWQEGTRFEWAWPCPDCDEYFIPRFKLLVWPEGASPTDAAKSARLACPHCGVLIEDAQKVGMNARGLYIAPGQHVEDGRVVGSEPQNETASFWASGLCSPWRTFGHRARAVLTAEKSGDPARKQAVINTGLGELFHVAGDAPAWSAVGALRDAYTTGEVPDAVRLVTCGVDVQKNRLVYVVRGWGVNYESWLLEHGELWGETEHPSVWDEQLADLLASEYRDLKIARMLIDSGYRPGDTKDRRSDNQVYRFCRLHKGRVYPTKGHDKQDKPYRMSKIDVTLRGKVQKHGLELWHLDTDYFKSWVHARLEWPQGESGAWHLSQDTTDDYCQQVVAESRTVSASGAVTWVRLRRENHYFDCEALNVAAAHMLRVHDIKSLSTPIEQGESRLLSQINRPAAPRGDTQTPFL